MSLGNTMKKAGVKTLEKRGPVWTGPSGEGLNGGITYSLLCRFLCCRERFRLRVVEGLAPAEGFNHRLEFGQMWHVCEEALASERRHFGEVVGTTLWEDNLLAYARQLCKKYPLQQEEVDHWYNVCKVQFPIYVKYWSQHPDVKERTPLLQETPFDVSYKLPSGRTVRLRGKWDSVDLIGKGKDAGVYLQENKTKGDIDEQQLRRQLTFDLQTMMYLVALHEGRYSSPLIEVIPKGQMLAGIRYNVIRRPLSGGAGTIKRHEATKNKPAESKEDYYARVRSIIDGTGLNSKGEHYPGPSYFFMRWKVEIGQHDVAKFRDQCLDPILEQLCNWWEWITATDPAPEEYGYGVHWRHPFGVYNVLDEGGSSDLDAYLTSGSETGLRRTDNLFPELQDASSN